jgi:hypothetical protein
MHGHKFIILLAIGLALSFLMLVPSAAWAYIGPGPGMEFVPIFSSLLVWVGLAVGAALLWPVQMVLRSVKRWRQQPAGGC